MNKILYFTATWCGPCKVFGPILTETLKESFPQVELEKVDVDENTSLTLQYQVRSFPTMVMLKDGVEVKRFSGLVSKVKLKEILTSV